MMQTKPETKMGANVCGIQGRLGKRRVVLFGSSVNPPTKAHLAILKHFAGQKGIDEVWLLPVYKHMYDEKSGLVSFDERVNMCQQAFGSIRKVRVKEIERDLFNEHAARLESEGRSEALGKIKLGTVDVLNYLKDIHKNTEFHWVLGADNFVDICAGKWKNGEMIPELATLHIIVRDGKPSEEEIREMKYGENAHVHNIESIDPSISSTKARATTDVEELESIVPTNVSKYIQTMGFYAFGIANL